MATNDDACTSCTPKRRKVYLDADSPLSVPVSTLRRRLAREESDVLEAAASSEQRCCSINVPLVSPNTTTRTIWSLWEDCPKIFPKKKFTTCLDEFGTERLPHSTTTKAGAVAMLMSIVVSNGLTWKALGDLIGFVNMLFEPEPNVLPRSKYLFRKLWSRKTKEHAKFYELCATCDSILGENNQPGKNCEVCGEERKANGDSPSLVMFSMQKQLRYVVEKNKDELHTNITRNMTSGSNPAIKSDMTSSAGYLALKDSVGLCHGDLTLTINTDGSPLFESSNTSVWPIQFVLNELPPRTRFKNCTLAGLWIAKRHPDMSVFLAKFVEEVNQMGPLLWEQDGHHYTSRMVVVCCAVGAPARAAVLNMKQHNGYSSCTWCLITCEYVDNCVRYISSHPVEDRTSALVVRDSQLAPELDTDINGVKGPTPLMNLQGFDLVRGCSVEYMHSVLLGVTRQLNDYYFGSSHSSECYYIGSRTHLTKVNRLLLSIKPPHCITRLPRSVTDRAHWKASELRNWLLFYSIPCTADVLPREHWRHLAKLSEAVHILLREKISERDLARADELLKDFVGRCIALYGEAFMTFNVHALLHLAASAKFLGPLWAHSAFVFEGGNGR
ncbi:uncharacterized protein LOC135373439 [Ornithodoros turicata]|uniref:uncharacterized protein LOC135373439 n=1 Tax=Ornithodoros turicata TaxID=34597 RepID=UPI003138E762